jgi:queuine/archaeosine tRNA-ribosyltransferase
MMAGIRSAIEQGQFKAFKEEFLGLYGFSGPEGSDE